MIEYRCKKCILPNTFPQINFDKNGICTYCKLNLGVPPLKQNRLPDKILRSKKIVLGLSGGRDSTFGLLKVYEVNPNIVTFTYEWPLVNDLARANASRIVSHLGLEHIVRSPETYKQLKYIRKIVLALSKKPDPAAIPLLLAPDKYFFWEVNKIAKKNKSETIIFCAGNELEFTDFKSLAMGAQPSQDEGMLSYSISNTLKMIYGMIKIYIKNPRLFMAGLIIPIQTSFITFVYKRNIFYLFDYISWDEKEIEKKLEGLWEGPERNNSKSNWRSGDGTAHFYNFLYRSLLGFDERTCNLANKVRSGLLSRTEALEIDGHYNIPDYDELKKYASKVGFSLENFLVDWNKNNPINKFNVGD